MPDRSDDELRKAACIRCHSLKLRCIRVLRDAGCKRCRQAEAECIVRPSKRVKKTAEASASSEAGLSYQQVSNPYKATSPGDLPPNDEPRGLPVAHMDYAEQRGPSQPALLSFQNPMSESTFHQPSSQFGGAGSLRSQHHDYLANPPPSHLLSSFDEPDLSAFMASLLEANIDTPLLPVDESTSAMSVVFEGDETSSAQSPPLAGSTFVQRPDPVAANEWARQLVALNSSLCSHHESAWDYVRFFSAQSSPISAGTTTTSTLTRPLSLSKDSSPPSPPTCLPIDETLRLAQQLLSLLSQSSSGGGDRAPALSLAGGEASSDASQQRDLSSTFLILSSYTRLMSTSNHILESIRLALDADVLPMTLASSCGAFSLADLLGLQFTGEKQTGSRLHAVLIIDSMELVLRDIAGYLGLSPTRLGDLDNGTLRAREGVQFSGKGAAGHFSGLLGSISPSLEAEQAELFEKIKGIRQRVVESPYCRK